MSPLFFSSLISSRILPSDPGTSSSDQKSTHHEMEDIESVSQVGSHVSFPQWDSMQGMCVGGVVYMVCVGGVVWVV